MTIQDDVRNDLDVEIFDVIGKSVTLINKSAYVYNTRGEKTSSTNVSSTITVVPYNIMNDRQTHQPFGDLLEGDMDVAVPYTVTINIGDVLTIGGTNYEVKEKAENYLPDNVVTIVRVTKQH